MHQRTRPRLVCRGRIEACASGKDRQRASLLSGCIKTQRSNTNGRCIRRGRAVTYLNQTPLETGCSGCPSLGRGQNAGRNDRPPERPARFKRAMLERDSGESGRSLLVLRVLGTSEHCLRPPRPLPHKNGVGPLESDLSLGDPGCFIGSCKAHPGSLRMVSFSKEHDRNVFSRPFYSVKWGHRIS